MQVNRSPTKRRVDRSKHVARRVCEKFMHSLGGMRRCRHYVVAGRGCGYVAGTGRLNFLQASLAEYLLNGFNPRGHRWHGDQRGERGEVQNRIQTESGFG